MAFTAVLNTRTAIKIKLRHLAQLTPRAAPPILRAMSSRPEPALLPRIARLVVVGAICLSLGMHWALLQGIAWTGMLISYARDGAVMEAVQKTFDGQHGCALCHKVKQGRESSGKQQHQQQNGDSAQKITAVLVELTRLVMPAGDTFEYSPLHAQPVHRSELPETPPPRRGLV